MLKQIIRVSNPSFAHLLNVFRRWLNLLFAKPNPAFPYGRILFWVYLNSEWVKMVDADYRVRNYLEGYEWILDESTGQYFWADQEDLLDI